MHTIAPPVTGSMGDMGTPIPALTDFLHLISSLMFVDMIV